VTDKRLYCSFCGKSDLEVEQLIAAPEVFICNWCVALCSEIIAKANNKAHMATAGYPCGSLGEEV